MDAREAQLEWAIIDSLLCEPRKWFVFRKETRRVDADTSAYSVSIYDSPGGKPSQVNIWQFPDGWGLSGDRQRGAMVRYAFPELLARLKHNGWRRVYGFPRLEPNDDGHT